VGEDVRAVEGITIVGPLQTLVDLAAVLDDVRWEQALESALRKKLVTLADIEDALPRLSASRTPGVGRIRAVLAIRPPGAPATESLLETYMVQLLRSVGAPTPQRQVVIERAGRFVARVDLAWPELGVFLELDGQHHKDQPVYDAARQTAVVAATGWLPGRFTWRQVVHNEVATGRAVLDLLAQAAAQRSVRS
jgi:very-short-patch-repair endonuclease